MTTLGGIANSALREWAQRQRAGQNAPRRPWRGLQPWGQAYEAVAGSWERDQAALPESRRKMPPAFRDGMARPKQLAPGTPGAWSPRRDWFVWMLLAGRGFGKTRSLAEWVRERVEDEGARRLVFVAATAQDARDTMIEGESGILAVSSPAFMPTYNPSLARVTWPNGAYALVRSSEEPNRLRGPQYDTAWCDELAAWKYLEDAWDNMAFGLRLPTARGLEPKVAVSTTPKPLKKLREILALDSCEMVRGSTFENAANLAASYIATVIQPYVGTTKGRQELEAELLGEVEGALWRRQVLDDTRISWSEWEEMEDDIGRLLAGVDPSGGVTETGIIVGGAGDQLRPYYKSPRPADLERWEQIGIDRHLYALDDLSAGGSPDAWAQACAEAGAKWGLDAFIAEQNQGGAMVESTIRTRDKRTPIRLVTASRGKYARAEPVAALFEQGRGHIVGHLQRLEDELCEWVPGIGKESPNRLDALVWMATASILKNRARASDLSSSLSAINSDMQAPSTWRRR